MKKTLIKREHFKVMPWKNGAGVTAEVDIDPKDTDFREMKFNWRVSSAQIQEENRFSEFPGYDRILTVLSGEGLLLNNEELGPFEVFEFEGEDQIQCSLIEGAVEDLNIIFKRDQYRASLQLVHVTGPMDLKLTSGVHFFLSLSSTINLADMDLEPPQFLKIENDDDATISVVAEEFPAYMLRIDIVEIQRQ